MKDESKYVVYKSETSGKYYVRYPDSPEKEITQTEYESLLEEKNRHLDNIVNHKQVFQQAPKRKLLETISQDGKELLIYENHTFQETKYFEHGTVRGTFYETPHVVAVDFICNEKKGNGDFMNALELLWEYRRKTDKRAVILDKLNQKFIDKLISQHEIKPQIFQVTREAVMILW